MKLFQHNIHPSPLILGLLCSRVTRSLVILVFVQSWQSCNFVSSSAVSSLSSYFSISQPRHPKPDVRVVHIFFYVPHPFQPLDQPKSLASICNSSSFQGLLGPFSLLESAKPSAAIYNSSSFQGLLGQTFLFLISSPLGLLESSSCF